jgi:hypothetical protein
MGIGRDFGPDKSHQNGSSMELLLIEKLTTPIFELPDKGLA